MSSRYNIEPPTEGKIILHTTLGDLDVELWPKEAPLAVRNFCQLCMENYYDGVIFHRIIKDFIAQTGDPTGTGKGGESIYDGKPFKDEFSQRIKFNHPGQVAMASAIESGENTNQSQFFFSLGACEWLNRKHTIFGKITGDTIYNALKFNEIDIGENERPMEPEPRILSTEILHCPFDDIVPRESRHVREERERAEKERKKKKKLKKEKKHLDKRNLNLVSFAQDTDQEEEITLAPTTAQSEQKIKEKKISKKNEEPPPEISESLDTADKSVKRKTDSKKDMKKKEKEKKKKESENILNEYKQIREQLKTSKAEAVATRIENQEKESDSKLMSEFERRRSKYINRNSATKDRQKKTLEMLASFNSKLKSAHEGDADTQNTKTNTGGLESEEYKGGIGENRMEDEGIIDANDRSWMHATLKFKRHIDDKFRDSSLEESDLTVFDSKTKRGMEELEELSNQKKKVKHTD